MHEVLKNDLKEILATDIDWGYFSGKVILITGASGMLASYIVETLLELNNNGSLKLPVKIIGFVRNIEYAESKYKGIDKNFLQLIEQDLRHGLCEFGEVDVIIHTASQASPKYYGKDPVGTILPNIIGTSNLLELANIKKVKNFLFFSSGEVYGIQNKEDKIITEKSYGLIDPLNIRSCYALSKKMGEAMCVAWGHQYGIGVKIVRPFHTYGPGMKLDDGRVFADFVSNVVNGEDIVMKSDGKQKRPFCYITDATIGIFKVLLCGKNSNAYNIANPTQNVAIIELANILTGLFPEKGLEVIMHNELLDDYIKSPINEQLPDISKLMALGWSPKVSIAEGFNRTIRSYL